MGYDPLEWLKEDSASAEPEAEIEVAQAAEADSAEAQPGAEEPALDAAPEAPQEEPEIEAEAEAPAEPLEAQGDAALLDLQSSLQIMDVALLKPQLEERLGKLKEITLRADEDIAVDGAGMQLLLAFVQQAKSDGVTLQWETLPAPIVEAARLLNTEQVLLAD